MYTPKNIDEWLSERITFIENILSTSKDKNQTSDCIIALSNFQYCQKLYNQLKDSKNDEQLKSLFRNIASKLIFESIYMLDLQEYKSIHIHGVSFPTKERSKLPQEIIDNIQLWRLAFSNIYNQVTEISN